MFPAHLAAKADTAPPHCLRVARRMVVTSRSNGGSVAPDFCLSSISGYYAPEIFLL
jgi:hypothetical protein